MTKTKASGGATLAGNATSTNTIKEKKALSALNAFLQKHRVERGCAYMYTSLTGGSFHIDYASMDTFYTLYNECLKQREWPALTEKHLDVAPVIIDLDFRQTSANRLYTREMIREFCQIIIHYILEYTKPTSTELHCYVLEKPLPRQNLKQPHIYKDGVHIVIPDIITLPHIQYAIRERFLEEYPDFFIDCFTTSPKDIYDEAVIERNNWMMYGSKKPDETHPWLVTSLYKVTWDPSAPYAPRSFANITNTVKILDPQLIKTLSIRHAADHITRTPLTNKGETLLKQINNTQDDTQSKDGYKSIASHTTMAYRATTAFDNITEIAGLLVDALNHARADNYNTWIRVGWCLHNINKDVLLPKWTEFSRKSTKYVPNECERLWTNMRDQGLGIGSLLMWVKEDNIEEYTRIYQKYLDVQITTSLSGTHTDIARVIYMMFKEQYVCASIKNNKWYEFKNHRWNEIEIGYTLRQRISEDVFKLYIDEAMKLQYQAKHTGDEFIQQRCLKNARKYLDVANKLKTAGFKDSIIKESAELFYDPEFYDKLDEYPHLLGFTNGVLDLDNYTFRDGRPDDFLSMTTGYDYALEDDPKVQDDIMHFIRSIMPNEPMETYLLCTLAYKLHGDKFLEELWFWTGIGRNGKGTLYSLLKKTLGGYAYEPDITIVTCTRKSSSSATPEIVKAKGKRLLCAAEPDDEDAQSKFKVNRLKQFRGNDIIQCRAMYKDCIEFKPQFSMIFQMNDKPELSKVDDAIARSLKIINFPYVFTANPTASNHKLINMSLKNKFEKDVSYHQQFMRILVKYHHQYISKRVVLQEPIEVTHETMEYIQSNNPVLDWINTMYEKTNDYNDKIKVDDIFSEYVMDNGPIPKKRFGEYVRMAGYASMVSNGTRVYRGLKRKEQPLLIET
jgi:P4 family phage/plasmid primase-like protien